MFSARFWKGVNFCRLGACLGMLCAALSFSLSDNAFAQDYGESLLDIAPVDLMRKEAPFAEAEMSRYLADYGAAKNMSDAEAEKFFKDKGWSDRRLIYLTVKIALGLEDLQRGPSSELLKNVPKELLPTKAERKVIEKHRAEIERILVQEH